MCNTCLTVFGPVVFYAASAFYTPSVLIMECSNHSGDLFIIVPADYIVHGVAAIRHGLNAEVTMILLRAINEFKYVFRPSRFSDYFLICPHSHFIRFK